MDTKKEAKKYLNKYFKAQYIYENDLEFKSLVRLLNKAQKAVKNRSTPAVNGQKIQSNCVHSYEHIATVRELKFKCKSCGHEKWEQSF